VRYNYYYGFSDSFRNTNTPSSKINNYLNDWYYGIKNTPYLSKGADFDWTDAIVNANYTVKP